MSAKNKQKLDYKQLKISGDYQYSSEKEQEEQKEQEKQSEEGKFFKYIENKSEDINYFLFIILILIILVIWQKNYLK